MGPGSALACGAARPSELARDDSDFDFQSNSLKANIRNLAAGYARVLLDITLRKPRGRRECRVKASPMARLQNKKQAAVTTGSAKSSGIPCAMVLRLIRDLPGEPGFLAPIIARLVTTRLGASVGAPGPHDFAVRFGAVRLRRNSARVANAPTASPPHVS